MLQPRVQHRLLGEHAVELFHARVHRPQRACAEQVGHVVQQPLVEGQRLLHQARACAQHLAHHAALVAAVVIQRLGCVGHGPARGQHDPQPPVAAEAVVDQVLQVLCLDRRPAEHDGAGIGQHVFGQQAIVDQLAPVGLEGMCPLRAVQRLVVGLVLRTMAVAVFVHHHRVCPGHHHLLVHEFGYQRLQQRGFAVVVGLGDPDQVALRHLEAACPLRKGAARVGLRLDDAHRNRRLCCKGADQCQAGVGGRVVQHDDLAWRQRLRGDGSEAQLQVLGVVEVGHHHRHTWRRRLAQPRQPVGVPGGHLCRRHARQQCQQLAHVGRVGELLAAQLVVVAPDGQALGFVGQQLRDGLAHLVDVEVGHQRAGVFVDDVDKTAGTIKAHHRHADVEGLHHDAGERVFARRQRKHVAGCEVKGRLAGLPGDEEAFVQIQAFEVAVGVGRQHLRHLAHPHEGHRAALHQAVHLAGHLHEKVEALARVAVAATHDQQRVL